MRSALIGLATALLFSPAVALAQDIPFELGGEVLDFSDKNALGLDEPEGIETVTIFAPEAGASQFNHGVVLLPFKDRLYAQWQSSEKDEDAPETVVLYSVSDDGSSWSAPKPMTEPWADGYISSGGMWTDGETLVAYLNTWPVDAEIRGGYVQYITSEDGETWTEPQRVTMADGEPLDAIFEQDPHTLPSGRIINSAHFQPGLIAAPIYTDDPKGISGWTRGEMENLPSASPDISRELEPSWFLRKDGAAVTIFRDQGNSFFRLAAVSTDDGETWSKPVMTNMPDSRTKQSAGNLPDGRAYIVGNPNAHRARFPLAVMLSDDGYMFDYGYVLRTSDDMQPLRFEGLYKRPGYSYPKSVVWKDHLYVAYATNKEDAELTRIPISSLVRPAEE